MGTPCTTSGCRPAEKSHNESGGEKELFCVRHSMERGVIENMHHGVLGTGTKRFVLAGQDCKDFESRAWDFDGEIGGV